LIGGRRADTGRHRSECRLPPRSSFGDLSDQIDALWACDAPLHRRLPYRRSVRTWRLASRVKLDPGGNRHDKILVHLRSHPGARLVGSNSRRHRRSRWVMGAALATTLTAPVRPAAMFRALREGRVILGTQARRPLRTSRRAARRAPDTGVLLPQAPNRLT
jgi:hypothetical protein